MITTIILLQKAVLRVFCNSFITYLAPQKEHGFQYILQKKKKQKKKRFYRIRPAFYSSVQYLNLLMVKLENKQLPKTNCWSPVDC